jgi:hypothetical protein
MIQGGGYLHKKIRIILKSNKAEANYFSTVVFIFVAVLMFSFIINLFSIISTKRQLDHAVDQMVKQIQLAGGVNADTDALFTFLIANINDAENINYTIDATYRSPRPPGMVNAVQLGMPFYVTIQGRANLGGFWNFNLTRVTIVARGAGVSERFWK